MATPRGADRLFSLAALALLLLFLLRALALLLLRYPVEYGEGTTWAYAHLLLARGSYFLPIHAEPWIHGTYPPLFPVLQALLGGSLAAGRLVALAGTLLGAVSFVAIVERFGVVRRRALVWAAVFLGLPATHEWGATCRVDALALGLSLAGMALVTRLEERRGELWAAPVLAAAFLTKQVALAAPVAVVLGLWLRRDRRRAFEFAALYGGLVLLVMAFLQWQSGGEMWRHLVTYTGFIGWHVGPFVRWATRFVFLFPVFLPIAFMYRRMFANRPVGVYVLTGLGALLLAGKPGASANYLLEPGAALLLAAAVGVEARLAELGAVAERRRDLSLLVVVQLIILCQPGRPFEWLDLLRAGDNEREAVAALRSAPGEAPVLADDLGLVLAAGREPLLEPFQFGFLAGAGLFDPAPILSGLREGRFGMVLLGPRLRSIPGLAAEVERSYRLDGQAGGYAVWRPPPAAPPADAAPRRQARPRG